MRRREEVPGVLVSFGNIGDLWHPGGTPDALETSGEWVNYPELSGDTQRSQTLKKSPAMIHGGILCL